MQALLIYDLNFGQSELKTLMRSRGYFSAWVSNGVTYQLPQSTLWKPDLELKTALTDIQNSIAELNRTGQFSLNNIILTRCIVVSASPWDGIPGIP